MGAKGMLPFLFHLLYRTAANAKGESAAAVEAASKPTTRNRRVEPFCTFPWWRAGGHIAAAKIVARDSIRADG